MFALIGWLALGFVLADDGALQMASVKPKANTDVKNDPDTIREVNQLIEQGWGQLQMGKPAEALPLLDKAAKLAPKNASVLVGLGWALLKTDDLDAAEKYFKRAIVVDSRSWSALHGLGQLSFLRGNFTAAKAYLNKIPPREAEAWLTLAKINLLQGQYDEAADWARKLAATGNDSDLVGHIMAAAIVGELDDDLRKEIEPPKRKGTPEADRSGKPPLKPSGKAAN
jgi:tetratricopeptide (TPR) repeat protein